MAVQDLAEGVSSREAAVEELKELPTDVGLDTLAERMNICVTLTKYKYHKISQDVRVVLTLMSIWMWIKSSKNILSLIKSRGRCSTLTKK